MSQSDSLRERLRAAATATPVDARDRWMVSYADFITLLFAFFVVMYAISSVNDEKYRVLTAAFEQVFNTPILALDEIQTGEPTVAASPHIVDVPDVIGFADPLDGDTEIDNSTAAIRERFAGFVDADVLDVAVNKDWLEISLNGSIAFEPGSAVVRTPARAALSALSEFLNGFDEPVTVEGYTDNVPIDGGGGDAAGPSNWTLSSARASAVAALLEAAGVHRARLSAVGYGENHPRRSNATPAGRAANRRVVIVVARRGNQARNLNATPFGSAFAFVRRESDQPQPPVTKRRTDDGRLLFSNQ